MKTPTIHTAHTIETGEFTYHAPSTRQLSAKELRIKRLCATIAARDGVGERAAYRALVAMRRAAGDPLMSAFTLQLATEWYG